MRINPINNCNFGALLGKREISYHHNLGHDEATIIQHVYPFKDEFITKEDEKRIVQKLKAEHFFNNIAKNIFPTRPSKLEADVVFEDPLPFTMCDLTIARQMPYAENVSQEALDFMESPEYATTTIKNTGYFAPETVRL